MSLTFPNPMRSFDPTVQCVRFSGHDKAIEVSFFVELDALVKLNPDLVREETEILNEFDAQITKIHKAGAKAYAQNKGKYVFTLTLDSF